MARLHAVRGVTRVAHLEVRASRSLDHHHGGGATDGKACFGKRPPDFSVVVFFERADTPATVQDVTGQRRGPGHRRGGGKHRRR